ncbi:MAG TPA: PaaI family thioesterase [Acidimicrobiales bacterium]|nr:PaaI family thioesterase [Acidimicrobiales bacterium]
MQVPPNCDLTLGMVCVDKSEPGRTTWRMTADERFANTAGILQGGMLGAFADSAMGASAVTFSLRDGDGGRRRITCANVEMKTSFLKAVPIGSVLTCVAAVISGGDRVVFCEAEVRDEAERLVAKASSTYVITPRD